MGMQIQGASGKVYDFIRHDWAHPPKDSHCVYIYAQSGIYFSPQYIGMTERPFTERFAEHNSDGINRCALANGTDSIFIHSRGGTLLAAYCKDELTAIEDDLLAKYKTPCNIQKN